MKRKFAVFAMIMAVIFMVFSFSGCRILDIAEDIIDLIQEDNNNATTNNSTTNNNNSTTSSSESIEGYWYSYDDYTVTGFWGGIVYEDAIEIGTYETSGDTVYIHIMDSSLYSAGDYQYTWYLEYLDSDSTSDILTLTDSDGYYMEFYRTLDYGMTPDGSSSGSTSGSSSYTVDDFAYGIRGYWESSDGYCIDINLDTGYSIGVVNSEWIDQNLTYTLNDINPDDGLTGYMYVNDYGMNIYIELDGTDPYNASGMWFDGTYYYLITKYD
jgi:hypothetical protein